MQRGSLKEASAALLKDPAQIQQRQPQGPRLQQRQAEGAGTALARETCETVASDDVLDLSTELQMYPEFTGLQADRFVAFFVLLTTDDLQTRAGNAVLDLSTELQMPLSNCSW